MPYFQGIEPGMVWLEAHFRILVWRLFPALVLGAAVILGLIRYEVKIATTYQTAKVLQSQPIAGQALFNRIVLIDIDGKTRLLREDDWHIVTTPGHLVCVGKTRFLLRRWTRYSLQLPFYCPALRITKPNGLSSPAPGPNVGQP